MAPTEITVFQANNLVTLLTDFGLDDPYVGQLKGAMLCRNPTVRILDLCHSLPVQDILAAARTLHASYSYFPPGSIHLTIVDPGVGSQRRLLAARSDAQLFIAPDNGILSLLLREQVIKSVRLLGNPSLFAQNISPTFHGRDIMAPAAAALAGGFPYKDIGRQMEMASCLQLPLPRPTFTASHIKGQVVQIDHFGNLQTNITRADVEWLVHSGNVTVGIRDQKVSLGRIYAEADPGCLLALIDSAGYLELAVNQGSAAKFLGCAVGEPVLVSCIGWSKGYPKSTSA
ncbi:SAM hydrolase/SAM-dependent halogenase family protein [Candidatus Electronema sp. PJ]|uniref:SAM hydrolase/SAM-dependent halogenase family protein n=1 Tax=Candidatus Electronema sp. PJ TaxID=3401572 RepID=UPI003AA8145A